MLRLHAVLVALVITLVMFSASGIAQASTTTASVTPTIVKMSYHDSGYDLAAGYRYTIGLQSGSTWYGSVARAEVSAGPVEITLSGSHLKIVINDNAVFDEDIGDITATVTISVGCDGSGTVEVNGYGNVGGFSIDHSYRIYIYTETVPIYMPLPSTMTSQVTISRQAMNCVVTNPSLTPNGENIQSQISYNPLFASIMNALGGGATLAVIIIVLGFGILVLLLVLGKLGGAKKLVKSAVG